MAAAARRLNRELTDFNKDPPFGSVVDLLDGDIFSWRVTIPSPCRFAGEGLQLHMGFSSDYPFEPPECKWINCPTADCELSYVYKHVLTNRGLANLDILCYWSPVLTSSKVVLSVMSLANTYVIDYPIPRDMRGRSSNAGGFPTVCGLQNLGNTCFVNASLQCIRSVPGYCPSCPTICYCPSCRGCDNIGFGGHLANVLACMSWCAERGLNMAPSLFVQKISLIHHAYGDGAQQDADEFIVRLLDSISGSPLHSMATGEVTSSLVCLQSGGHTETTEAFTSLSLPLGNDVSYTSVTSAMQEYFRAEQVTDVDCTCCPSRGAGQPSAAMKGLRISKFPGVLILTLKRFDAFGRRLGTQVRFQLENFRISPCSPYVYDLCAVLLHHGNEKAGHYTACVRSSSGEWYHCNDEVVEQKTPEEVSQETGSVYILFYTQRKNRPSSWRFYDRDALTAATLPETFHYAAVSHQCYESTETGLSQQEALRTICLKLTFENDYYRVRVPQKRPSIRDLEKAIDSAIGSFEFTTHSAKYRDDEGDFCRLNEATFTEFVATMACRDSASPNVILWRLHVEAFPVQPNECASLSSERPDSGCVHSLGIRHQPSANAKQIKRGMAAIVGKTACRKPVCGLSNSESSDGALSDESWEMIGCPLLDAVACHGVSPDSGPAKCFHPKTYFQVPGGGRISIANLRKCGDAVVGLDGVNALVDNCICFPAEPLDWIRITFAGSSHPFVVTSDHRIIVQDADGNRDVQQAQDLSPDREHYIFDGRVRRKVEKVERIRQTVQRFAVTFKDDSAVLASTRPNRRPRQGPRTEGDEIMFAACQGERVSAQCRTRQLMRAANVGVQRTFIDDERSMNRLQRRSLSVGDGPLTASIFSRGSKNHDHHHPEECQVCEVHRRHLLDPSRPQCRHGVYCVRCHFPHEERVCFRPCSCVGRM